MNEDYHEDCDDPPADKNGNDATERVSSHQSNVQSSTLSQLQLQHLLLTFSSAKSLSSSLLDFILIVCCPPIVLGHILGKNHFSSSSSPL